MPFRRVLVTRNNPYHVPLPWNQAEREYVYLFEEIRVIYPIDSSKFIDVAASWMDGWMQGLFLDL